MITKFTVCLASLIAIAGLTALPFILALLTARLEEWTKDPDDDEPEPDNEPETLKR